MNKKMDADHSAQSSRGIDGPSSSQQGTPSEITREGALELALSKLCLHRTLHSGEDKELEGRIPSADEFVDGQPSSSLICKLAHTAPSNRHEASQSGANDSGIVDSGDGDEDPTSSTKSQSALGSYSGKQPALASGADYRRESDEGYPTSSRGSQAGTDNGPASHRQQLTSVEDDSGASAGGHSTPSSPNQKTSEDTLPDGMVLKLWRLPVWMMFVPGERGTRVYDPNHLLSSPGFTMADSSSEPAAEASPSQQASAGSQSSSRRRRGKERKRRSKK